MSLPAAGLTSHPGPLDRRARRPSAVPEASDGVLVTTGQVLFDTAAAQGVQRDDSGRRLGAMLRRYFVGTAVGDSRPRPRPAPSRYAFLEDALMSREMDRL